VKLTRNCVKSKRSLSGEDVRSTTDWLAERKPVEAVARQVSGAHSDAINKILGRFFNAKLIGPTGSVQIEAPSGTFAEAQEQHPFSY
jgi:hypothetical protein